MEIKRIVIMVMSAMMFCGGCATISKTGQGFVQGAKGFKEGFKEDVLSARSLLSRTDGWIRENLW